jgi:homoserine dehydrogenase
MKRLNIALLGFGNVGQEFCRLLLDYSSKLTEKYGYNYQVIAITTRSKGSLFNRNGLDLERALKDIFNKGVFSTNNPDYSIFKPLEIIANRDVDLVIEITTLNIENGQPATDHIFKSLQAGKHVITANKGPIAFNYEQLKTLAETNKCLFYFEGTVMDGAPVFNLIRDTLPECQVTGFRGILNSTTNYILSEMTSGASFAKALQTAQTMGWAEADPTMDLAGWDSAAKTAALLNVLMNAKTTPQKIERTGIDKISGKKLKEALADGKVIKLICEGFKDGTSCFGKVEPRAIPITNHLANVNGTSSALTIETDLMGELTITVAEPKIRQTAYAILSDLIAVTKKLAI